MGSKTSGLRLTRLGPASPWADHNWPMAYLAQHFSTELDEKGAIRLPSHDVLPRGAVVQVT